MGPLVALWLVEFVWKIQFVSGASVVSKPSFNFPNEDRGCIITIPSNRRFAPSIIDQKSQSELVPVQNSINGEWYIKIKENERIRATCGRGNPLINHDPYYYLLLTCVRETEFRDNDDELLLLPDGIECSNPRKPTPTVYRNGTCSEKGTNFFVEFVAEIPPRKFYSVCVDEYSSGTLYSSSYIDGESFANGLVESSGSRPDFRGQEFYPFPIKQAYKWENAVEHLSELLGSEELVDRYFPSQQHRFSRGHLFPNADGLKRFEKHATFYYINTVPQWQLLNGGNWATVEQDVRDLATHLKRRFEVTTGAFSVTTLKDANNNDVEIWLARDNTGKLRLPVPRLVWKVVHDPVGNAAVAIVQVNNPWDINVSGRRSARNSTNPSDILCNDLCPSMRWLRSGEFHSQRKGYTYCCDVQELRKSISYVPNLQYLNLLGADANASNTDYSTDYDDDSKSGSGEDEEEEEDLDSGSDSDESSSSSIEDTKLKLRNETLLFSFTDLMKTLTIS